jgi:pentatricopeptide repeat protein
MTLGVTVTAPGWVGNGRNVECRLKLEEAPRKDSHGVVVVVHRPWRSMDVPQELTDWREMNRNHRGFSETISEDGPLSGRRHRHRRRIRARIAAIIGVVVVVATHSILRGSLASTPSAAAAEAFAFAPLPSARSRRRRRASEASPRVRSVLLLLLLRAHGAPWGAAAAGLEDGTDDGVEKVGPPEDPQRRFQRRPHNRRQQQPPPSSGDRPMRTNHQHHRYPRTSKDRRNDSLRIGHHPLLSLNLNLDALASTSTTLEGGGEGGGELAQELYQRISALYQEGYYAVPPDIVSFNSVLKAWRDDPERALQFWEQEMVPRIEDDENDYYCNNENNNNMVTSGPESRPGAISQQRAQGQSWREDRRQLGRRAPLLEPNVRSYNTFLWALARAGMFRQSEMLMDSMRHDQSLVLPDKITYNTVLLSYYNARCDDDGAPTASSPSDDRDLLPDRSLKLLDEMLASTYVKPDAVTFNTILSIWATVGTRDAALKTQELLQLMATLGVRPDVYTYTAVIQAWASVRDTSDVDGSSNGDAPSASQRALDVLEEMKNVDIEPNAVTYTIVMQALCRNNQPQAATTLLHEVIEQASDEVRPDAVMFSALMDGWARWIKGNPHDTPEQRKAAASEAVQAVLDLLSQMKSLSQTWPDVAPNERTYTSVLAALARSRHFSSGVRAERMLEDMVQRGIIPSTVHWNAVLDAYAKSPRSDKVREARRVWTKMVSRAKVEPDLVTYHTLLSAAASTRSNVDDDIRQDCVRTGLQAFALLQRDPTVGPTSLSFHYLFKIVGRFVPSGTDHRRSAVHASFRLCCDAGCLNDALLRQLRAHVVVSPTEEQRMVEALVLPSCWRPNMGVADLPPSFSRQSSQVGAS